MTTDRTPEHARPEAACRRCGLSAKAAIAGVFCDPPQGSSHDFPDYAARPEAAPCHPYDDPCGGAGGPCRNHGGVVRPEAAPGLSEILANHQPQEPTQGGIMNTLPDYTLDELLAHFRDQEQRAGTAPAGLAWKDAADLLGSVMKRVADEAQEQ